jgi:hypothetical protein
MMPRMNDESLRRANAFLAAVRDRIAVGELLVETPAEIGRDLAWRRPAAPTGSSTRDRSTPGSGRR